MDTQSQPMRVCTKNIKCDGRPLPLTAFSFNKLGRFNRRSECKECEKFLRNERRNLRRGAPPRKIRPPRIHEEVPGATERILRSIAMERGRIELEKLLLAERIAEVDAALEKLDAAEKATREMVQK